MIIRDCAVNVQLEAIKIPPIARQLSFKGHVVQSYATSRHFWHKVTPLKDQDTSEGTPPLAPAQVLPSSVSWHLVGHQVGAPWEGAQMEGHP